MIVGYLLNVAVMSSMAVVYIDYGIFVLPYFSLYKANLLQKDKLMVSMMYCAVTKYWILVIFDI